MVATQVRVRQVRTLKVRRMLQVRVMQVGRIGYRWGGCKWGPCCCGCRRWGQCKAARFRWSCTQRRCDASGSDTLTGGSDSLSASPCHTACPMMDKKRGQLSQPRPTGSTPAFRPKADVSSGTGPIHSDMLLQSAASGAGVTTSCLPSRGAWGARECHRVDGMRTNPGPGRGPEVSPGLPLQLKPSLARRAAG